MKTKKLIRIIFLSGILGVLFISYCHLESRWIKTKKIVIKSVEIPKSFVGKRLVFISDIHHGPFLSIERVKRMVRRINKLKPDIILMGGDYVHREPDFIPPVFNELSELTPTYGIYAVLGNHDHWENPDLTRSMMIRNGIRICDNKSYWQRIENDSIKIGGVGDLWEDSQILDSTVNDLKTTDFCILISHNPDFIESIESDLIDIVLAGHTHGGQMTFFGSWAPMLPSKYGQKYRYGFKQYKNMQTYITSGIGTITPPLRFFCRPEIVQMELRNE
jgi:predicted MPP superfamily phosphohydrolase